MLPSVVEGCLLAYHRLHATHTGRDFRVFNIHFDVGAELGPLPTTERTYGEDRWITIIRLISGSVLCRVSLGSSSGAVPNTR